MDYPEVQSENAKLRSLAAELVLARRSERDLRNELAKTHASLSWRLTRPLRSMRAALQRSGLPINQTLGGLFGVVRTYRQGGITSVFTKTLHHYTQRQKFNATAQIHLPSFYPGGRRRTASDIFSTRVLIVGEMSIPQCKKYRVSQKAELLSRIGYEPTIVSWNDAEAVRSNLQTHTVAIFYRVPAVPSIVAILEEARNLGVKTYWEVDDLIFDPDGYLTNSSLNELSPTERKSILNGMELYQTALKLCDAGIGSTRTLAEVMRKTTGRPAYVIENALDLESTIAARKARKKVKSKSASDAITIVYGSGTKTHNVDFREAEQAILNVLSQRPNVRLRIVGELEISDRFLPFAKQIDRFPFSNFDDYLLVLAEADISIAPLEASIFNDAKSNIKYLEAAILGLPSVCSPREAFRSVIQDGVNGLLADNPTQWEEHLLALVESKELRQKIAKAAHHDVYRRYNQRSIATSQVAPLINSEPKRPAAFRILMANVFFDPQSFGGATIVAEEMARRFAKLDGVEVYVFTSWSKTSAPEYALVRYDVRGCSVIAARNPEFNNRYFDIEDHAMGDIFGSVLDAVKPDIVHLHSIQTMGVSLGSECLRREIPYAITMHDAWWLCERQFMVTAENKFCKQSVIDPKVCAKCVPDSTFNSYRTRLLKGALLSASGLIVPSEFFKRFYGMNGIDEKNIAVNKNGVLPPSVDYTRSHSSKIRFGYVGGATPIKGYDLICKVFSELPECGVELVLVDNGLNRGQRTIDVHNLKANNPIHVLPAYTQDTVDHFYRDIDILLFPTQAQESFGLTVREALIRDVWVIATDSGGVVEDIVPGVNGDIIPMSSDIKYLKDAILRIIDRRDFLENYSNPHKDRIQTFETQSNQLFEHLVGLAKSPNTQRMRRMEL